MKSEVELQGGDLHAGVVTDQTNGVVFGGAMDAVEDGLGIDEREIWPQNEQDDDLLGVDDGSLFYADFPPLPDFPCMSSTSSSSSTPAPVKTVPCPTSSPSASSSSAASWAVLRSDAEDLDQYQYHHCYQHDPMDAIATPAALSSTASMEIPQPPDLGVDNNDGGCGGLDDCSIDVMDTFECMDLLETNDFFDSSSIFPNEENPLDDFPQQFQQEEQEHEHAFQTQQQPQQETDHHKEDHQQPLTGPNNDEEKIQGGEGPDDEMHNLFLEWLKSNKDIVSASDLRSVKLKKSTIECAARRLGGGKEAMKQLLKLILEWVQTSHLQNKKRKETTPSSNLVNQFQDPNPNPNSFGVLESNTSLNQTQWISPAAPHVTYPARVMTPIPQPTMVEYAGGNPYSNGAAGSNNLNGYPSARTNYQMLESAGSWPWSQFGVGSQYNNQSFPDIQPAANALAAAGHGNQYAYQYFHGPGDRLMRLGPLATKEARKKRMARQRRYLTHHKHGNLHSQHNHNHQNPSTDTHTRLGSDNCTAAMPAHANPLNWMHWPSVAGGAPSAAPMVPAESIPEPQAVDRTAMQTQNHNQGRALSDRRQGWIKPEKNLRFLLQKVLKQSDVGSLGRIVLPKKEAEAHLPELEARDGIAIAMEDIGTSRVWNLRYRYWPNNKSRMYLLENTGEFVRANGLQEGDFVVLYSDVKCGKYLIRGVKVRQPGTKAENKKGGKLQKSQHGNAATTAKAGANINANNALPCSPSNTQRQKTENATAASKIG